MTINNKKSFVSSLKKANKFICKDGVCLDHFRVVHLKKVGEKTFLYASNRFTIYRELIDSVSINTDVSFDAKDMISFLQKAPYDVLDLTFKTDERYVYDEDGKAIEIDGSYVSESYSYLYWKDLAYNRFGCHDYCEIPAQVSKLELDDIFPTRFSEEVEMPNGEIKKLMSLHGKFSLIKFLESTCILNNSFLKNTLSVLDKNIKIQGNAYKPFLFSDGKIDILVAQARG